MNAPRRRPSLGTFLPGLVFSFRSSLREQLRWRRVAIGVAGLLLLTIVQMVIVLADRGRHPAADDYVMFTGIVVLNLILPFVSLITALGLLGGEIEEGTLVYLLVRPCPRIAILLGRTLAAAAATGLLLGLMFLSCLAAVRLLGAADSRVEPPLPPFGLVRHLIAVGVLGAVAFTALYAALALFVKRPLVALLLGVGHALVWEGIIAFLPGRIGSYTFTQNLHALLFNHPAIGAWPRRVLFQDIRAVPPTADALVFLAGAVALALLAAWFRFRGREFG
jgi:ABC-type transport system involved in multi-copper enzyme maturation permease subunit